MSTKVLGNRGEDIACNILKTKGYKVIDRNYRTKYGEIDIVTKKDDEIIFVEVKTRSSVKFGMPEEAVSKSKISKITKSIYLYLEAKKLQNSKIKLEVLSILVSFEGVVKYKLLKV